MMSPFKTARTFQFIGGNLALDFCNTMGGKRGARACDYLDSPLSYLAWCRQAGLLNAPQSIRCLQRVGGRPAEAAAVLRRAVELREAIFRIFAACRAGKQAPRADLACLNSELGRALGRLRLVSGGGVEGFGWRWEIEEGALDHALGPVAHAAGTLLADRHALAHLNMCSGDTCGWLFIDSSKNHSRRWCDMRDCGNRAKIRRYRLKERRALKAP